MVKLKQHRSRLKASTLVETLMAVAVLGITISIGLMIFTNIIRSQKHYAKKKAQFYIEAKIIEDQENNTFLNETIEKELFTLEKEVKSYEGSSKLNEIIYSAISQDGDELAKVQQLIIISHEE